MPTVRTKFQPWKEIEVGERELASLKAQGLLADESAGEEQVSQPDEIDDAEETREAPRNNKKETEK